MKFKKMLVCAMAVAVMASSVLSVSAAAPSLTESKQPVDQKDVAVGLSNGLKVDVDTAKNGTATLSTVASNKKKTVTVGRYATVNGVKYTVTTVGANAFAKCKKATKVKLSAKVVKVNAKAFSGAKKLKTVVFRTTSKVTVKKGAFKGLKTKKMTIKINKKMSKKNYKKLVKQLRKAGFKGKIKKVKM